MATLEKQSNRVETFLTEFSLKKEKIQNSIVDLDKSISVNERLTQVSKDIEDLRASLHDSVHFLPPYSVKMRQDEIVSLEKKLKEKEDDLIPKKKFGFKTKKKENVDVKKLAIKEENFPEIQEKILENLMDSYFTIQNKDSETLLYEENELNGNDVMLNNLNNVNIKLTGSPSTLRLVNLRNTILQCGPVQTSVFVENCQNCTFYVSCQQLRIHSSIKLDIYLRVNSRCIIEDSQSIRFAPYTWNDSRINELHTLARLDPTLERFDLIDDFNWLANSSPSPNWSKIPTSERIVPPM